MSKLKNSNVQCVSLTGQDQVKYDIIYLFKASIIPQLPPKWPAASGQEPDWLWGPWTETGTAFSSVELCTIWKWKVKNCLKVERGKCYSSYKKTLKYRAANDPSVFTITAPTMAFSWFKVHTGAFTFKTLFRLRQWIICSSIYLIST